MLKLILIGDEKVGKSALLLRFAVSVGLQKMRKRESPKEQ